MELKLTLNDYWKYVEDGLNRTLMELKHNQPPELLICACVLIEP